jgi:hypothetical protein
MKTLKQQFQQYSYDSDMTLADREQVITVRDALTQVKKWLEQHKNDELSLPSKQYYYSNNAQDMQELGKKNMLLKLLDEISLPAKDTQRESDK